MIIIEKFEKNTTHLVAKFPQKLWSEYLNYFDRNSVNYYVKRQTKKVNVWKFDNMKSWIW